MAYSKTKAMPASLLIVPGQMPYALAGHEKPKL
jgi:hypothetical protein